MLSYTIYCNIASSYASVISQKKKSKFALPWLTFVTVVTEILNSNKKLLVSPLIAVPLAIPPPQSIPSNHMLLTPEKVSSFRFSQQL